MLTPCKPAVRRPRPPGDAFARIASAARTLLESRLWSTIYNPKASLEEREAAKAAVDDVDAQAEIIARRVSGSGAYKPTMTNTEVEALVLATEGKR